VSRLESGAAYVTRPGDRRRLLWAGNTVFDVVLGGEHTGGAVFLPAGRPHALGICSEHARLITVTAPAGFADFVQEAGVPVSGDQPATWEFDVGRLLAAAPRHAIEILGPPPALPTG
jgi:hypothetical protein